MTPNDNTQILLAVNESLSYPPGITIGPSFEENFTESPIELVPGEQLSLLDIRIAGTSEVRLVTYKGQDTKDKSWELTDTVVKAPSGWKVVHRHFHAEGDAHSQDTPLTYGSYLDLDNLLASQHPLTDSHDELLFIIIHQVYELWFTQILHEGKLLQIRLEDGDGPGALHTARRIAKILKTIVGQLDILETLTPQQFATFRPNLGTASGFQSAQFRHLEALLGQRDFPESILARDATLASYVNKRPLFASLLHYLMTQGYDIPNEVLDRDPALAWHSHPVVTQSLVRLYRQDSRDPAEVCEALVDIDEGVQEWRYRHVMMVERIIGSRRGTGGSAGADYLRSTLFHPSFPDLWEARGGD